MVVLLKNGCSVRHTCSTIFGSLSVAKIFEKQVRSSSYLAQFFFKENPHLYGKFIERLFLLQVLYTKLFERIFFGTPICSNKVYQRKLKPGDRLWALEITYWELCLYGQLFCIRQTFVPY